MDTVGAIFSILGVIIALVGFSYTIKYVQKSKKASEQAKEIAEEVRKDLSKTDVISEFASALAALDEVKRLHRYKNKAWLVIQERYAVAKKSLITVKTSFLDMSDDHQEVIQSAVSEISNIEDEVERLLLKNKEPDIARLNKTISLHIDKLQGIKVEIKNQIGR